MNTIDVLQNTAANTNRGPSDVIWGNCPWLDLIENPARGMTFWDDFIGGGNIPTAGSGAIAQGLSDKWSIYAYQGATLVDGAGEGGVLTFGSDGDNEGVALGPTSGAFRLVTTSTLALNKKLWFECRISPSTVTATKTEYFAGLFSGFLTAGLPTAAVPITTTDDTLADKNLIGFHIKATASPTEVCFVYKLAGQTVVYPTNLQTLMASSGNSVLTAGAWVKLGFLFDPDAPTKQITSASTGQTAGQVKRPLIRIFVNGLELPAFLTSDNLGGSAFPTAFMGPGLACMNQSGSSPGTMSVDWVRVAQLANS